MNLTKSSNIIKDGTEVLIGGRVIGKICGNDSECCDLSNGHYIDLNYYVVPNGKTFDDEIMCLNTDFQILGIRKVCPNCGQEVESDLEFVDDGLGKCTMCPICNSSADLEMYYEN